MQGFRFVLDLSLRVLSGEPDCSWWADIVLEAQMDDQTVRIQSKGHGFEGVDRDRVGALFAKIAALLEIQSEFIRAALVPE